MAQSGTVTVNQDENVNVLLETRKQLLKKEEIRTHYTIQVFSGAYANAEKVLKECKKSIKDYRSRLLYETPNYKIWIGEFRNRLDADRALLTVHEKYPGAFVFKPDSKKQKTPKP